MSRDEIYQAIDRERDYQDEKWGTLEEHNHTLEEWCDILYQRVDKAWRNCRTPNTTNPKQALHEILTVASVAIACMEQHGVSEREQVKD